MVAGLHTSGSARPADADRLRQLAEQIDGVLDDLHRCPAGEPADPDARMSDGVPPKDFMRAAAVVFEVALGVLARDEREPARVAAVAGRLNDVIMRRVGRAAGAYLGTLLDRNRRAQRAERQRVAREMHDRAAHGVGVALQSLELHGLFAARDPERASAQLVTARQSLLEAIETIRAIATEVRDALGGLDLREALTAYVDRFAGPQIKSVVQVADDATTLSPAIAEELYLVVREAVYNTFLHADATRLEVRVEIDDAVVRAEVTDDGTGFDPADTTGIGIASMRERLEALGGTLELTRPQSGGAGVRAVIPLPEPVRPR